MAHFDADDFMDEICNERIGELLVQEPEAAVEDDPWEHIICSNNNEFLVHAYRWMKVNPAVAVSFDDCHRPLSLRRFENQHHDLYFKFTCSNSYCEVHYLFSNLKWLADKYHRESDSSYDLKVMVDDWHLTGSSDWRMVHKSLVALNLPHYDNSMDREMDRLRTAMYVREIEYSRYVEKTESYIMNALSQLIKTPFDNIVDMQESCLEVTELRGLLDGVKACGLFPKINRCKDICGVKAGAFGARYNELRQSRAWSYSELYVKRDRDNYFYYGTTPLVDSKVYKVKDHLYIIAQQQEHKCPDTRTWLTITLNCRKGKYNWYALNRTLQTLFPDTDTTPIYAKLYTKYGTKR